MPDTIVAKGSDSKFKPHPEGQFIGQCVDTIDLGEKVEQYPGQPERLTHKCVLVFRTGEVNQETGEPLDIAKEFTVSMGEKANLRKFLEQWRGKAYSEDEAKKGVPVDKLVGQYGMLSVAHNTSGAGKTYANIIACVGVPAQFRTALPKFGDYERDEYWGKRKAEYAEAAKKFKHEAGVDRGRNAHDDFEDFPGALQDEDDDLPF